MEKNRQTATENTKYLYKVSYGNLQICKFISLNLVRITKNQQLYNFLVTFNEILKSMEIIFK